MGVAALAEVVNVCNKGGQAAHGTHPVNLTTPN